MSFMSSAKAKALLEVSSITSGPRVNPNQTNTLMKNTFFIQAMYSFGKLNTMEVDRIILKLMEPKALLKIMSNRRRGLRLTLACRFW